MIDGPIGPCLVLTGSSPTRPARNRLGQARARPAPARLVDAIPVAASWIGLVCTRAAASTAHLPAALPDLWRALTGGERAPLTPVSVVGASQASGDFFARGDYPSVLGIIAALNIFVGLFNLLPVLPLDGGHIAVAWYAAARSWLYTRLRRPGPGPVNYAKLTPVTYVAVAILIALTALSIIVDLVNPVTVT